MKEIELEEPLSWDAIVYTLDAYAIAKINIDWSYGYKELGKGQYRLVKSFLGDSNKINVSVEFEIS